MAGRPRARDARALEDRGRPAADNCYRPPEQLPPPTALTELTWSVPPPAADALDDEPPDAEPPDAEPPDADPPEPEPVEPEPLVPDVPELDPLPMLDPPVIRPRTSTRCPTCWARLLPVSITVPIVPAPPEAPEPDPEAPALEPEPDAEPDPDDPEADDPEPAVPEPVDPDADEPDPDPEPPRETSVRM